MKMDFQGAGDFVLVMTDRVWCCEKIPSAYRPHLGAKAGGADRNRTCDLLIANETLYQLSYDPNQFFANLLRLKSFGDDFELLYRASIL